MEKDEEEVVTRPPVFGGEDDLTSYYSAKSKLTVSALASLYSLSSPLSSSSFSSTSPLGSILEEDEEKEEEEEEEGIEDVVMVLSSDEEEEDGEDTVDDGGICRTREQGGGGESDEEEEANRLRLQCMLQLTGNAMRLKGLQELRDMHRIATRLTAVADEEASRLKKEETKVTNFLLKEGQKSGKVESVSSKRACAAKSSANDTHSSKPRRHNDKDQRPLVDDDEAREAKDLEIFERMERLIEETEKLSTSNQEYSKKINTLEDKIKKSEIESSKKSTAWHLSKRKMENQIQQLEKRCAILEDKLGKYINRPPPPMKNPASILKQRNATSNNSNTNTNTENTSKPNDRKQAGKKMTRFQVTSTATEGCGESEKEDVILNNHSNVVKTHPLPSSPSNGSRAEGTDTEEDKENQPISSETEPLPELPGESEKVEKKAKLSKHSQVTRTVYKNGDIKEVRPDGSIQYFFANDGLRHYVCPNGLEMTTYKNGQIQRKNPCGIVEILYPNGCVKIIGSDGMEEFIFQDNTVYSKDDNGSTVITMPNGQKEIHTAKWKKRLYPDGTTKTMFSDGTSETIYQNGRRRVKDANGVLISDTYHLADHGVAIGQGVDDK